MYLRKQPKLLVSIKDYAIEVIDDAELTNNGVYSYNTIKSIEFILEKTDWFVSVFSWVVDLFSSILVGGKFSSKAHIRLKLKDKVLKIYLIDADLDQAKEIVAVVKERL